MKESTLLREIMLAMTKLGNRVFRNNVGMGWTGKTSGPAKTLSTVTINPGDILIRKARPFHAGLCKGSSDLIGWTSIQITPDMVGNSAAIFTAYELKTPKVRVTREQQNFIDAVNNSGGIGKVIRKLEDL